MFGRKKDKPTTKKKTSQPKKEQTKKAKSKAALARDVQKKMQAKAEEGCPFC